MRRLLAVVTVVTFMLISFAGVSYASLYRESDAQVVYYPQFRENFFRAEREINVKNELARAIDKAEEERKAQEEKAQAQDEKTASVSEHKEAVTVSPTAKKTTTAARKTTVSSSKPKPTTSSSKPPLTRSERIALEQKKAEQILAGYIRKYPILQGVKIYVQDCPHNWEGCAYYTKGIILVDPDHTHSLEEIIAHEVKHIIDYRTDGDIDFNDYHE